MITPRKNTVGKTGPMQEVSSWEIRKDLNECNEDAVKDTRKNRSELKRLGTKFYGKYWGATECCCGNCGTVYRFPRGDYNSEDVETFWDLTIREKCPCCQKPINEQMHIDSQIYFERREMLIFGATMLKLIETKPLDPPEDE